MTYTIEFRKSAAKAFRRLDIQTTEKIKKVIDKLVDEPRPFGYKKLVDEENLYRIRVGNYRVIYEIYDRVLVVVILKVARRGEDTY